MRLGATHLLDSLRGLGYVYVLLRPSGVEHQIFFICFWTVIVNFFFFFFTGSFPCRVGGKGNFGLQVNKLTKIGVCVVLPDIGSTYTAVCSCKELQVCLKN